MWSLPQNALETLHQCFQEPRCSAPQHPAAWGAGQKACQGQYLGAERDEPTPEHSTIATTLRGLTAEVRLVK